jgi:hypothetical protein
MINPNGCASDFQDLGKLVIDIRVKKTLVSFHENGDCW